MAKILRNECSLLHRQNAIGRELSRRKITRLLVWGAALAIILWGAGASMLHGHAGGGGSGGQGEKQEG